MNFRQVEAFRAVMVTGSASRAADLLQITQPAISRSILELEKLTGFALFDRIRGRLVPTAEGQLFFRDVESSFQGLDRLRVSAARIRDFGTGDIRMASLAAMGSTLVPHALRLFRERHPSMAVTLQVAASSSVRELVMASRFDVGLAADEIDVTGLEHQLFATPKAVCAMPAGHPLAERGVVTPEDLAGEPFIALAPEDTVRRKLDKVFESKGVRPRVVAETPNSSTVCALAMEGLGVGLVNPYAADGYAARGVVFRPFSAAVHFRTLLIFRPDLPKSRIVRDLAACLFEARNLRADRLVN
ncbi:DNA-binding transcriptional LysR family regulator [Acidovorax soli]|jgi:DNA-binding transcriptional LysR family regulator|uniref:DNA-binding transcriptional LysR family regulator n=1 Tax=Acidovorax soli TaxID=592050 RepID=A0A7X0PI11_9BURK|nr:LysR substrate-binding domain-containing protein [Acidovorax soli]MBB6562241.1 DNA-binding transcriptional LysR family regulator [Acidovorax soli]